jgi:hypothetical protein
MGLCGIGREVSAGGVESRSFGCRGAGMVFEGQFFIWQFRNSGIVIINTDMRLSLNSVPDLQRDVHLKSLGIYDLSWRGLEKDMLRGRPQ